MLLGSALVLCALVLASGHAAACERDKDDKPAAHDHEHQAHDPEHEGDDDQDDGDDQPAATRDATQEATTTTRGSAVADTGGNLADGTSATASVRWAARVRAGRANAVAGASADTITQHAAARATGKAKVEVVQVAAVVNIGIAHAGTGANAAPPPVATAAPPPAAAPAISTGNAVAVGQAATTGIAQRAVVGSGGTSRQTTTVTNVGVAVANTGLNVAIGTTKTPTGGVRPGDAIAVGNLSSTSITQRATGAASGRAVLVIDQRAVVVNVGYAVANSGGNVAISAADDPALAVDPTVLDVIRAVLAPLFDATPSSVRAADGGGGATIRTGAAVAVGNVATTSVLQAAAGHATGASSATARQDAAVANVGIGLANTGLNAASGTEPPGPAPPNVAAAAPPTAAAELARLLMPLTTLDWLDGPNPYAALAGAVDVGDLHLDLSAAFRGTRPTGGAGVRVWQASGVVDIGVRIEDPPDPSPTPTRAPASPAAPTLVPALATGDARALGNRAVVGVSQSLQSTGPATVPRRPVVRAAVRAATAVAPDGRGAAAVYASVSVAAEAPAGTLPATGAPTGTPSLALIGLALLALGVVTSACSYAPIRWRGATEPVRASRR